MCVQCWATAATAATGAAGVRSYAAARQPRWLTPQRLRLLTIALLSIAVLIAGVRLS
jgi:hypothetical protein